MKKIIIFSALFVLIMGILCVIFWPFFSKLRDPQYREEFSRWIERLGVGGFFILFGIQFIQIIVAVIPGEPVELLAGMAYGAVGGLIVCLIGCVAASSLTFLLVRKFGAPIVIRIFGKEKLDSYKFFSNTKKVEAAVFVLFLVPGTPKDMLNYIVPLSRISMPRFILIANFARIPSIVTSTILGDSVIGGNWILFTIIFIITAALGVFGMKFRERITDFFRRKRGRGDAGAEP